MPCVRAVAVASLVQGYLHCLFQSWFAFCKTGLHPSSLGPPAASNRSNLVAQGIQLFGFILAPLMFLATSSKNFLMPWLFQAFLPFRASFKVWRFLPSWLLYPSATALPCLGKEDFSFPKLSSKLDMAAGTESLAFLVLFKASL